MELMDFSVVCKTFVALALIIGNIILEPVKRVRRTLSWNVFLDNYKGR